ncbi:MAG: hypothetical protein KGZ97_13295 [Bacteroidetes bacterium]|nr:hypothetical protein [Bacteroidota bacterium]
MREKLQLLTKLNDIINANNLDVGLFRTLIKSITSIKFIDLTFYNEEKLLYAKREKILCINKQIFARAALMRDLERDCIKYIELRDLLDIEHSMFCIDKEQVVFFYTGKGKNDKEVVEILNESA